MDILDKPYTYYSAQFKLEAINRVLVNHDCLPVSLELGLKSQGMLTLIRSYKETGIMSLLRGRTTNREQRAREIEEKKTKNCVARI